MIKYNNNSNINDWYFDESDIIKVYRNGAVCYYKVTTSGGTPTFDVCYAVVDDISQYSETEFVDVYNKADSKWYKLNNLNQYEEYGVYGSGRTITYYDGKLTVDDGYEYQYSGGSWVNVGEVSGSTIETVWLDYPSTNNFNANFDIGHYWGEGYKMVFNTYLSGSYSSDRGSFWRYNQHTPIEFSFYSNGFYYDMHNPTSTSAPNVITNDYSYRILKSSSFSNYENGQIMNITLTYGTIKAELEETGAVIMTDSTGVEGQNWYSGLYQASIGTMQSYNRCHLSSIKVYNANDELVNDLKFVKNQGVTGSQEISLYDSVLNVTYNNTNSYTPVYHIVSSGSSEYPIYYDEKSNPLNNLTFSSMTEATEYAYNNCVYDGMRATIAGDGYYFDSEDENGWVVNPFNQYEYIRTENAAAKYYNFNTGFYPTTANTFEVKVEFVDMSIDWGAIISWRPGGTQNFEFDTVTSGYQAIVRTGDNKGTTYRPDIGTNNPTVYTLPLSASSGTYSINGGATQTIQYNYTAMSLPASKPMGIFGEATGNNHKGAVAKLYYLKVYDGNGNLVKHYIPSDSNGTPCFYDIVNGDYILNTYSGTDKGTCTLGPQV